MDKQQVTAGPSNQQPSNLSIQRKKSTTQVLRRKASSVYSRITDASTITTYSIATTDVASSSLQIEEMLRELGHLQASAEGGAKVSGAPKVTEDGQSSRTQGSERASVSHKAPRFPRPLGVADSALKQHVMPESSKDAMLKLGRDKGKAVEHVRERESKTDQRSGVNVKAGEGHKALNPTESSRDTGAGIHVPPVPEKGTPWAKATIVEEPELAYASKVRVSRTRAVSVSAKRVHPTLGDNDGSCPPRVDAVTRDSSRLSSTAVKDSNVAAPGNTGVDALSPSLTQKNTNSRASKTPLNVTKDLPGVSVPEIDGNVSRPSDGAKLSRKGSSRDPKSSSVTTAKEFPVPATHIAQNSAGSDGTKLVRKNSYRVPKPGESKGEPTEACNAEGTSLVRRNSSRSARLSNDISGAAKELSNTPSASLSTIKEGSSKQGDQLTCKSSAQGAVPTTDGTSRRMDPTPNILAEHIDINSARAPADCPIDADEEDEQVGDPGSILYRCAVAGSQASTITSEIKFGLEDSQCKPEALRKLASEFDMSMQEFYACATILAGMYPVPSIGHSLLATTEDTSRELVKKLSVFDGGVEARRSLDATLRYVHFNVARVSKTVDDGYTEGTGNEKPLPPLPAGCQLGNDDDDDIVVIAPGLQPGGEGDKVPSGSKESAVSFVAPTLTSSQVIGSAATSQGEGSRGVAHEQKKATPTTAPNRKRSGSAGPASLLRSTIRESSDTVTLAGIISSPLLSSNTLTLERFDGCPPTGTTLASVTETTLVDTGDLPPGEKAKQLIRGSILKKSRNPKPYKDGPDIKYVDGVSGIPRTMSLERIVQTLCSNEGAIDTEFQTMVFRCFRWWCTPREFVSQFSIVLSQARSGFKGGTPDVFANTDHKDVEAHVLNCISTWVHAYWRAGEDDEAIEELRRFLAIDFLLGGHSFGPLIQPFRDLDKFEAQLKERMRANNPNPLRPRTRHRINVVHRIEKKRTYSVKEQLLQLLNFPLLDTLDYKTPTKYDEREFIQEISRQLTLMTSELFLALQPEDFLVEFLEPKRERELCLNERDYWFHLERVRIWTRETILKSLSIKARAKAITFFVNLANGCVNLDNYCTAFYIWSGIHTSKAREMPMTLNSLKPSVHNRMRGLNELFSDSYFETMIARVRGLNSACCPLLDPFRDRMHRLADHGLRTWTNTSDANDKKSVLQVNVLLFQQLSQCVTELEKFQVRYWIRKCDIFRKFLKNSIPMCMSSEETISGLLEGHFKEERRAYKEAKKSNTNIQKEFDSFPIDWMPKMYSKMRSSIVFTDKNTF